MMPSTIETSSCIFKPQGPGVRPPRRGLAPGRAGELDQLPRPEAYGDGVDTGHALQIPAGLLLVQVARSDPSAVLPRKRRPDLSPAASRQVVVGQRAPVDNKRDLRVHFDVAVLLRAASPRHDELA